MVMGPCGGVRSDGGCEVGPYPCVFPVPVAWADRVEGVERELRRRYGPRPELATADEQSRRIGHLLSSGQLTCQVILLRAASPEP